MKKLNKFIILIMLFTIISNFISLWIYQVNAKSYSDMVDEAGKFIQKGQEESKTVKTEDITAEFVPIGQLLTMVGAGVMVAVTTFMGIKYLTSGPEAQGKLKQQLIGVVVSGVVIFGAYGIWKTIGQIVSQFDN